MGVQTAEAGRTCELAGTYPVFGMSGEEYGLEVLRVREIVGMADITSVPRVPSFIKGVINLRGEVIPVMDLRLKFGMPTGERTPDNCIVVATLGGTDIGLIVDRVSEVFDISAEEIQEMPSLGADVDTGFILGIGKVGNRVIILLNADRLLGATELPALALARAGGAAAGEQKNDL